ncbi:hypothetical protein MKW92_011762 [Papaver armeniacum]|nr:hypothetical protein MKW92_011762 [Papaver armeniacum]
MKNQKVSQNSNVGVGEDKISDLPDELIHHILSFVPTKCAMSTCILSKRWKYISNSIPTLDFRGWRAVKSTAKQKRLETQQFMDFLDTVLCLHDKPNIKKFYLSWDAFPDEPRVNKWISIVIKRKVEELFLKASPITSFIFPLSLFTCDSLTVLDLDGFKLNVPKTVCFPTLKLLRLSSMQLVNGMSPNHLLSNCPILEELSLMSCDGFRYEGLCIANPSLKRLNIWYGIFRETAVKICAPNLTTIRYGKEVPTDFIIDNFPSLVEADIDIYYDGETFVLIKLFEKLSNIKLLKVSVTSFRVCV